MKRFLLFLPMLLAVYFATAQENSAGKCFNVDYEKWNAGTKPSIYIDCGNNNVFNTGYELTMEVWIRIHSASWEQKIMGKIGEGIVGGYVIANSASSNYSEIFCPDRIAATFGQSSADSAWVHFATTFAAGDVLKTYINGINVGEISVPSSQILSNNAPFVIGIAPWDLYSFEYFGDIDEVRIWNVACTEEQIKENMHKTLTGTESGLVACYDFNAANGTNSPDKTANANHGTVMNADNDYWSWNNSFAPVGSYLLNDFFDVKAAWYGKNTTAYYAAASTSGLSMLTDIAEKHFDYALFGNDNAAGLSTENLPSGLPNDFKRLNRNWLINKGGNISASLVFNIENAAGGGETLPLNNNPELYTLLVSSSLTENFQVLCSANAVDGNVVTFNNIQLENKYYTIGMASTPSSVSTNLKTEILIYPNPASSFINISNVYNADIQLVDLSGKIIETKKSETANYRFNLTGISNGLYILQIKTKKGILRKKITIQN